MGAAQSIQVALSDTRFRLRLMMNDKSRICDRARTNVYEYLLEGKYELARIEAEDWVQKESAVAAFELLDKICEKLSQEIPDMLQKDESAITRAQSDFVGSICWASVKFKAELPELATVSDLLKEMYTACREGTWGVNNELVGYVNLSNDPTMSLIMQRLIESTALLSEEEQDVARVGIENCIASYASGTSSELIPQSRPSTGGARRPLSTLFMPPPYDHGSNLKM